MSFRTPIVSDRDGLRLTADECESLSNHLADVLCWFAGFNAAHAGRDSQPDLPPSLNRLRDVNIKLKGAF